MDREAPLSFFTLVRKLVSISILVSLCTLATSLAVAKLVPQEVFGRYSFYQSFFMILQNLLPFGLSMAIVVFKTKLTNYEYSALLSFSLFRIVPILASVISIISFIALLIMDDLQTFWVFLSLILFASFQSSLVIRLASLRVSYRLRELAQLMFFNSLLILVLTISYLYFDNSFFILYLILSAGSLIILYLSSRFEKRFVVRGAYLTYVQKKKYISFGWPVAVHAVLSSFLVAGDKVILGFLTDSFELGFYAYASATSSLFLFIVNNYASSWGVHLSNFIARSTDSDIKNYYNKHMFYPFFFILLIPPFYIVIWFFASFYNIEQVYEFYMICGIIVSAYSFYAITKYYMGYLNCLNKTKLVMKSTLFSCVFLVFSGYLFFEFIGLVGIAVAVFFSFLLNLLGNFYYSRKVVLEL